MFYEITIKTNGTIEIDQLQILPGMLYFYVPEFANYIMDNLNPGDSITLEDEEKDLIVIIDCYLSENNP